MNQTCVILDRLEPRLFLAAQAYDWKTVAIKGNGYIDGIVYANAPGGENVAYIHTDMGGAYRLDPSTNRFLPLNDWIGLGDAIQWNGAQTMAVDPTDPKRLYMVSGTYQSNAAFLRSTDQGRTWQRTDVSSIKVDGNGWGRNVGERLAVDPNKPSNLYYGAQYYSASASGLWKSTDFGATWNKVSFPVLGDIWNNNYSNANGVGLPFVLFDKTSATAGNATQTMYAGVATVANSTSKIYRTTDGGANWSPIPNQPATTLTPNRAVLTPDGSAMYIAYSNQAGPYGAGSGAVYKVTDPSSANPTWTLVTPVAGAYSGIAIDPTNSNTIYAANFDHYPDEIYRSTNAGASWTSLSIGSHMNTTAAPYAGSMGFSNTPHWVTDVQIDPFDNNVAMFVTGYGIFQTTNLTAATPTWSFFDDGFEQSAVLELVSPSTGPVHLISAIGDRDGYRHDNLDASPSIGRHGQNTGLAEGSNDDIDVAWDDPNYVVRLTRVSPYAQYSIDNGVTWAWFSSTNTAGGTAGAGQIAISRDGTKTLYEPDGTGRARFSTRSGSTWSAWTNPTTNQPANGAKIVADLVAAQTFYAISGNTVSRSTDGGANWTVMATTSNVSGATWLRAVPGQTGHLLISRGGSGLWRSTDGGVTWSSLGGGAISAANQVGVGAAPPGGAYPAIFIGGTVSGVNGFFRSDNQGATWTLISDLAHQYGSTTVIQGDPQVYGRLYLGINGRGIQYADIHTGPASLPAGWNSIDIGSPGSAGSAGESAGTFEVIGGGAGISGTSDQFRFAYQQLTGDGSITALVSDVTNGSPGNYSAKAGVMIRDGLASNAANALIALTPGAVNGATFQTRASTGASTGTIGSATTGVWPPYWVRLRRAGDQFTAFVSADGSNWTQIGSQTISMGATVFIGLASSASNNNQLNISHFQSVSIATPPNVSAAQYLYDTSLNKLSFTFDKDVSTSLLPENLTLSPGSIHAASVLWNAATNTATFTLPLPLNDGNYTATLSGVATKNLAGDAMTGDYPLPFFVLAADANRDRMVNALDFNVLAAHFGATGSTTLGDGDFNFDCSVNSLDFNALASGFGNSVPMPAQSLLQNAPPTTRDLFASSPLNLAEELLE